MKNAKKRTLQLGALLLLFSVGWKLGITCPILYFLHVPCPACGTTRAMLALLRGDLHAYLHYNVMAAPLCLAVVLLLLSRQSRYKRPLWVMIYAILGINLLYYLWRLPPYFAQGAFPPAL